MDEKSQTQNPEDRDIIDFVLNCRREADMAKRRRMLTNRDNFDMYHLRYDFSHKQPGQSREILSKTRMAVEQIKSFFQQALADTGEWWKAECSYPGGEETMKIKPHEITCLTNYMLNEADYFCHVGNQVQSGLLGSLAISKIHGYMKPRPKYVARTEGKGKSTKKKLVKIDDKTWRLKFDTTRQENFFPDPTGRGLFIVEDMWLDYFDVLDRAKGPEAIYDLAQVELIQGQTSANSMEEFRKARETGQNPEAPQAHRPQIKITEFWGTILDDENGEILHENVVCTVANDSFLIRKPTPNPLWHQNSPYNMAALVEVANSVWHTALMDAGVAHNRSLIELYNLFVDAAMGQVHQIKQLRKDALDNPAQVSHGITPGTTLVTNSSLPIGGKVLEPLTTVEVPQAAVQIYNIMNQEHNASVLTNDLRMGVTPFRQVKATEVVEASQSITSVFQGMAKNFEQKKIQPELERAWQTVAQNWDRISRDEFISLFGAERGAELSQMKPADVFEATVNGVRFRVFGISLTLSKAQDFRKLTTLLQTVGASEVMTEEFAKKYDFGKLLGEVMTALDIDKYKLEIPESVQATMQQQQQTQQGQPPPQGPQMMSQVPQAGSGSLADMMGGPQFPHTQFPGSPATKGMKQ